jgi:hypothetical protein
MPPPAAATYPTRAANAARTPPSSLLLSWLRFSVHNSQASVNAASTIPLARSVGPLWDRASQVVLDGAAPSSCTIWTETGGGIHRDL